MPGTLASCGLRPLAARLEAHEHTAVVGGAGGAAYRRHESLDVGVLGDDGGDLALVCDHGLEAHALGRFGEGEDLPGV